MQINNSQQVLIILKAVLAELVGLNYDSNVTWAEHIDAAKASLSAASDDINEEMEMKLREASGSYE